MCARAESGRVLRDAVASLAGAVDRFAQPPAPQTDDRRLGAVAIKILKPRP